MTKEAASAQRKTSDDDAALYDNVVVPRYTSRFARLIVDAIAPGLRAQVLDIGCGTGGSTLAILGRLDPGGRVIAIDRDSGLLDFARRRAMSLPGQQRVFFKSEPAEALSFGDGVFDIAIGNLVLHELTDPGPVLAELRRVLVPDGLLLVTRPLASTFEEIFDVFGEVAERKDLPLVQQRADQAARRYLTPAAFSAELTSAGLGDVEVTEHAFRLSYRNAREIFADPVIRFVGLSEWRWIAGFEPGGDRLLDEVERVLDVYFGGGPLSLTVRAGLGTART